MFSFLLFIFLNSRNWKRKTDNVFFSFSVFRFPFFCPLSDFLFAEKRKEEKEKRKESVTDCFQVPFSHVHMTKKTVTRKTETESVIHCYISFIHFPIFRSMKNTKRKMLFLLRLWRFRIHCQCSAFRFQEQGRTWKTKKRKMKTVSVFVFFHRKTERKKRKRLPLFPFWFIFRFPLFIWWKKQQKAENWQRKLFPLCIFCFHFYLPFCVSPVGIKGKNKKTKTEYVFRFPTFSFMFSTFVGNLYPCSVFRKSTTE